MMGVSRLLSLRLHQEVWAFPAHVVRSPWGRQSGLLFVVGGEAGHLLGREAELASVRSAVRVEAHAGLGGTRGGTLWGD